jgi:hypothetical protein
MSLLVQAATAAGRFVEECFDIGGLFSCIASPPSRIARSTVASGLPERSVQLRHEARRNRHAPLRRHASCDGGFFSEIASLADPAMLNIHVSGANRKSRAVLAMSPYKHRGQPKPSSG